jgi:nicotinamidase/pyrazinamidase
MKVMLQPGDALLVVDLQADFVSGSLAVRGAERIVPVMNRYAGRFRAHGLPVFATRDWHPADHVSFEEQGGLWPAHCVAGTRGAQLAAGLDLGPDTVIVSKGASAAVEAYSGFEGTSLDALLRKAGAKRLFVGGLATDYCVLHTVHDALRLGYCVMLLVDAIRAVDETPDDGVVAVRGMVRLGAVPMRFEDIAEREGVHG